jgi:hypothetical protein
MTLTTGDYNDQENNKPTVSVHWEDRTSTFGIFDLSPADEYSTNTEDFGIVGGADDVEIVDALDYDHCTEIWYFTNTALACVEMTGSIKRNRNTGDYTQDITLEFITYDMVAMYGNAADTTDISTVPTIYKLGEKEVDFSVLLVVSHAVSTLSFLFVSLSTVSLALALL